MASELLRDDDLQFDYEKQHFGDYEWQRENVRSTSHNSRGEARHLVKTIMFLEGSQATTSRPSGNISIKNGNA